MCSSTHKQMTQTKLFFFSLAWTGKYRALRNKSLTHERKRKPEMSVEKEV